MNDKRLILIGGGTRSGKSRFALSLATRLGPRRLFVATAQARDEEMAERIRKHQLQRAADFGLLEEPLALPEALHSITDFDVVLVDCLTFWLANMLLQDRTPAEIETRVHDLGSVLQRRSCHVIVVTNEVGLGVVPESSLGRTYRDIAGLAHQHLSQLADEVYFAVLGTMLRLKPHLELVPL